jgi:hypothetical protein
MANFECVTCGDMVDAEARTIVFPFECKWCQEGFEPIPARYIIQYKGCLGWTRSKNANTAGVFDNVDDAKIAATEYVDDFEYRVVPEGTPDDDSVNEKIAQAVEFMKYDADVCDCATCTEPEPLPEPELEPLSGFTRKHVRTLLEILSNPSTVEALESNEMKWNVPAMADSFKEQFDTDSQLILDLREQLDEANKTIAKSRKFIEEDVRFLQDYQKLLFELINLAQEYGFKAGVEGLANALESRERRVQDATALSNYWRGVSARFEEGYETERNKTWWEKLWS